MRNKPLSGLEKIGMSSCPCQVEVSAIHSVDQKPIGVDVAFSEIGPFSRQGVIIVSRFKWDPFGKSSDYFLKSGIILALSQHPFPVTFELGRKEWFWHSGFLFLVELIPKIVNILSGRQGSSRANVLHCLGGSMVGYFKREGESPVEPDLFKEQVEGFGSRKPQVLEYFLGFFLQRRTDSNAHGRRFEVIGCS